MGNTQATSALRGWTTIGKLMSSVVFGIFLPMRTHWSERAVGVIDPAMVLWYSRSGLLGHKRTRCGSWNAHGGRVEPFGDIETQVKGRKGLPPSTVSCISPPDIANRDASDCADRR